MKLFVYGTLRAQASHGHLLPGPRTTAWTRGRLIGIPHGYPALVDTDEGHVIGECVDIHPNQLPELDDYEGLGDNPEDYSRVSREVWIDGKQHIAQCYLLSVEGESAWLNQGGHPIPSGDWLKP